MSNATSERKKWPDDYAKTADDDKGIRCLKCGCRRLRTINSRPAPDGSYWRRKQCENCGTIRSTYEK